MRAQMKNKLMHDRLTVRCRYKYKQDTCKPKRRGESALGDGGLVTYLPMRVSTCVVSYYGRFAYGYVATRRR